MTEARGLPRLLELAIVLPIALAVLPLVLLLALLVRLDSPGSPLFRQPRVGRDGLHFSMWKLRSMRSGGTGPAVTAAGDPRVTRVGGLLRRTRLDELPQLVNVLRGDMALVGPRPEVPELVDTDDARWRRVLSVRPGITDPTTLAFADEEQRLRDLGGDPERTYREVLLPRKLASQIAWLERRTWVSDLGVLVATLRVLIRA